MSGYGEGLAVEGDSGDALDRLAVMQRDLLGYRLWGGYGP
jgi:hypothetical protein